MKQKLAILTNVISPARIPIYIGLGESFETLIAIGKPESNRKEWSDVGRELNRAGVKVEIAAGRSIEVGEGKYLQINPGYLKILLRESPDAVISIELGFRTMVAYIYTRLNKKPLWIWWAGTPHSERSLPSIKRRVRNFFASRNVRWISYGVESTRYLQSLGVPSERILQIQNAVDERLYTPIGKHAKPSGEGPLLLVVGQLIERKGIEPLLQAAQRLQAKGMTFTLRIIGSGPRRTSLENLSKELGLVNVEFIGGVPPEDLPEHYRCADALVFPTLEDVWGLVANEALLCGTPVICSKYAGCAAELLDAEEIFDPLDPSDFDRALTRAVSGAVRAPLMDRIWPMQRITETLKEDIEAVLHGYKRSDSIRTV